MSQFPFTHPATMAVMLLTLTTILAVTYAEEFDEAFYYRLPSGYTYGYLQTNPLEKFYQRESLLECAGIALNSQSEFFTYDKVSHLCKNYSPKSIMTVVRTNNINETAFYRHSQWIKAYALSMGAGSQVYGSFMNIGSPSTWKVDECVDTFCPNFFRHPILDFWEHLPIDEVKLVICKNQTAVVTLIFDGRNSSLKNWFSHARLKSSPWNDLSLTAPDYFSIKGLHDKRRFYITNHVQCLTESGWLSINQGSVYCQYDNRDRYPYIRYSDEKSKVLWSDGYGLADSMAIFIRLGQQK